MRWKVASLLCLLPISIAHAQQAASFSGLYITGFGQYSAGSSAQHDNGFVAPPPPSPPPPVVVTPPSGGALADGRYSLSGGFGGGGLGYNYQIGTFVLGVVADIGGGNASGSSALCGAPAHACGTRIDAISDVRGRVGYAFGNALVFASGGLAVDHLRAYDALFGVSGSAWRAGYAVGAGLEYKLTPQISLTAEYLHTQIDPSHLFDIVPGVPERISARLETVRVGVNYYFASSAPTPVIARY